MKKASGDVYIGLWSRGSQNGFGRTYLCNGQILNNKEQQDSVSSEENEVETDPPFDLFFEN